MDARRRSFVWAGGLALGSVLALTPLATAQEEGPNTGKISFGAGVDFTSEYWFRGIAQENQGIIAQPYANLSFPVVEGEDLGVSANLGTWNSWHFNGGSTTSGSNDFWYESDIYAGLSFSLPANFGASVSYTNLANPAGGGQFAEELSLGLSYDDSDLWGGDFALSPSVTLVKEIAGPGSDNPAPGQGALGWYLGVSASPSFTMNPEAEKPITIGVPVSAGFSLDDYYQDTMGNDDTFGFFDIGVSASMPLTGNTDYGQWSASVSAHYIYANDSAANIGQSFGALGGGDDDSIYFMGGISMSY